MNVYDGMTANQRLYLDAVMTRDTCIMEKVAAELMTDEIEDMLFRLDRMLITIGLGD